jgi:hypothetical protein
MSRPIADVSPSKDGDAGYASIDASLLDTESTNAKASRTVRLLGHLELPNPLALGLDMDRINQFNSLLLG